MKIHATVRSDLALFAELTGAREAAPLYELQWSLGQAWTAFCPIGRLLAIFGLSARPDGALEAWFACLPDASRLMLPMARAMRTILRTERSRVVPTFCLIQPGHAPGEKLARLLGFEATGETFNAPDAPVDGGQFWRYRP